MRTAVCAKVFETNDHITGYGECRELSYIEGSFPLHIPLAETHSILFFLSFNKELRKGHLEIISWCLEPFPGSWQLGDTVVAIRRDLSPRCFWEATVRITQNETDVCEQIATSPFLNHVNRMGEDDRFSAMAQLAIARHYVKDTYLLSEFFANRAESTHSPCQQRLFTHPEITTLLGGKFGNTDVCQDKKEGWGKPGDRKALWDSHMLTWELGDDERRKLCPGVQDEFLRSDKANWLLTAGALVAVRWPESQRSFISADNKDMECEALFWYRGEQSMDESDRGELTHYKLEKRQLPWALCKAMLTEGGALVLEKAMQYFGHWVRVMDWYRPTDRDFVTAKATDVPGLFLFKTSIMEPFEQEGRSKLLRQWTPKATYTESGRWHPLTMKELRSYCHNTAGVKIKEEYLLSLEERQGRKCYFPYTFPGGKKRQRSNPKSSACPPSRKMKFTQNVGDHACYVLAVASVVSAMGDDGVPGATRVAKVIAERGRTVTSSDLSSKVFDIANDELAQIGHKLQKSSQRDLLCIDASVAHVACVSGAAYPHCVAIYKGETYDPSERRTMELSIETLSENCRCKFSQSCVAWVKAVVPSWNEPSFRELLSAQKNDFITAMAWMLGDYGLKKVATRVLRECSKLDETHKNYVSWVVDVMKKELTKRGCGLRYMKGVFVGGTVPMVVQRRKHRSPSVGFFGGKVYIPWSLEKLEVAEAESRGVWPVPEGGGAATRSIVVVDPYAS